LFSNLNSTTDFYNGVAEEYSAQQLESVVGSTIANQIAQRQDTLEKPGYPAGYRLLDGSGYILVSRNNYYFGIDSNAAIIQQDSNGYTSTPMQDVIALVNYYKTNNLGPWANA